MSSHTTVDRNNLRRNPKAVVNVKRVEPLKKEHRELLLRSTLPFQMLLYYHYYFLWFYYIGAIIGYIWKNDLLYYPDRILAWEIATLIFHGCIDITRWHLGNKGNKTNRRSMLILFIILSVPVLIGNYFFWNWQTYVHRYDIVVNIGSWIIIFLEILTGITSIATFETIKAERT